MSDWTAISYYLFRGLDEKLDIYTNAGEIDEDRYKELEKAVKIYEKNCIISSYALREKLEQLEMIMLLQKGK